MKLSNHPPDIFHILFLSDTHLGFDYPLKPRVNRRRRGPDFFASYLKALQPALNRKVDFVVHGGDMFFRRKVHPSIVEKAFEPLLSVADSGIPVLIVPGNHERGNIPATLLESHPNIFIFHKPKTLTFQRNDKRIGFCGFPYYYKGVRHAFPRLLQKTGYAHQECDVLFLCLHHLFTGTYVGVQHYTFKNGKDIISPQTVPKEFNLVLSGHIHTAQEMMFDNNEKKLDVPIIYAGSTERTSFAERLEEKGAYVIHVDITEKPERVQPHFRTHSTRPMYRIELFADTIQSKEKFTRVILEQLRCLEQDSVVQIKISGEPAEIVFPLLTDSFLRTLAPDTMNVSFSWRGLKKR